MKPRNHVALAPQSGAGRHSTPKDYQRNPKHRLTQEAFQMKLKDQLISDYETQHDPYPDGECLSNKRVINVTDSYRLHVTVSPTIPQGHYHLKIESQWLGAKDPDGLQTRYQVTLSKKNLLDLTETILEATR
jgi:hypothetical protein